MRDSVVTRAQPRVGAHLLGDLEFVGRSVHRDHGCRRAQRAQHLDGHLAQPAGPDDHRS